MTDTKIVGILEIKIIALKRVTMFKEQYIIKHTVVEILLSRFLIKYVKCVIEYPLILRGERRHRSETPFTFSVNIVTGKRNERFNKRVTKIGIHFREILFFIA